MSNGAIVLLEPRKRFCTQVCMLYYLGFSCFAIENESVCFYCSSPPKLHMDCRPGEPKFLRDAGSLPFCISVQYHEISSFFFIYDGFHLLLVMVSRDKKRQALWSPQK